MKVLVTGGAGFIGRWLVKKLLQQGDEVTVLDNLYNGQKENVAEFEQDLERFVIGDIQDQELLKELFEQKFDICYHLAACINVQESIDHPRVVFNNDVIGTFNVLEEAKKHQTKVIFMSTCMVYDRAYNAEGISETHPTKAASPYAACKIAGEELALSYFHAYGLPTMVVRPFNTYGPFQKSSGEGGVISIFIHKAIQQEPFMIYGDGLQTRDFLYVEDCADFLIAAAHNEKALGQVINAGLNFDISINDLARTIDPKLPINHVTHIHPQSEIQKLLCNAQKAKQLLGWAPKHSLQEGLEKTRLWMESHVRA